MEKAKLAMILMLSNSQTSKYLKASSQERDVCFCKGYSISYSHSEGNITIFKEQDQIKCSTPPRAVAKYVSTFMNNL